MKQKLWSKTSARELSYFMSKDIFCPILLSLFKFASRSAAE
ncbi:hypothetical protein OIU78_015087 [Salix suchowensis]|nr:hypothetical protein OIU78_015087 [Salix suchowensis]